MADAVIVEPVSTPKFPANREKNREFLKFGPASHIREPMSPMILGLLRQIPYATQQGISEEEQGILVREQRIPAQTSEQCERQHLITSGRDALAALEFPAFSGLRRCNLISA